MEKILEDIAGLRGVRGAIIIGKDGLPISFVGEFQNDIDFIGACVSEFCFAAESMTSERFQAGHAKEISILSETSVIHLFDVNDDALLAIVTDDSCNRGLATLEGRRAAALLKEIL